MQALPPEVEHEQEEEPDVLGPDVEPRELLHDPLAPQLEGDVFLKWRVREMKERERERERGE